MEFCCNPSTADRMSCPFHGRESLVLPARFPGCLAENSDSIFGVIQLCLPASLGYAENVEIFYLATDNGIAVIRILHQAMDISRHIKKD